jgi:hypothetical protein
MRCEGRKAATGKYGEIMPASRGAVTQCELRVIGACAARVAAQRPRLRHWFPVPLATNRRECVRRRAAWIRSTCPNLGLAAVEMRYGTPPPPPPPPPLPPSPPPPRPTASPPPPSLRLDEKPLVALGVLSTVSSFVRAPCLHALRVYACVVCRAAIFHVARPNPDPNSNPDPVCRAANSSWA